MSETHEPWWGTAVQKTMENPPFWLGAIFILIGCGVSISWVNVNLFPYANYTLLGLGIILLLIGIYPYVNTDEASTNVNVKRLGITIDQPSQNQLVALNNNILRVAGRYRKLPEKRQVRLISYRDGAYRPHGTLDIRTAEKTWRAEYYTVVREPKERKIGVYVVGPGGKAQLDTYFRVCSENKAKNGDNSVWPGIEQLAPDIQLCVERE